MKEGYIKTKIGWIPDQWNINNIGNISKVVTKGTTPSMIGFDFEDKGINYIRAENINLFGKFEREFLKISEECNEKLSRSKIYENDILVSIVGYYLGKSAIVSKNEAPANTNQNLAIIRINNDNYSNQYIKSVLDSQYLKKYISKILTVGAQPSLSLEQIKKIYIPLPPLQEQKKIAEIISTWDLAIEKQEQLIEKKKELKKGLMQRLLSGEVRFKEFNDKWKIVSLANIFDRVTQKNETGCSNVLTISAQNGLINQEDFFNKSVSSKDLSGYYLLKKGDFAYNKSYSNGYPLGAIKRLNNYAEGVVSPLYICFRAKEKINTCFYEQYFESGFLNKEIFKIAQEGARNHGLLNVSVTEFFKDIKLVKPSLEEQEKIAKVLVDADKEIELLQKELEKFKLQKKGLMQRLLTGEVRVKVD